MVVFTFTRVTVLEVLEECDGVVTLAVRCFINGVTSEGVPRSQRGVWKEGRVALARVGCVVAVSRANSLGGTTRTLCVSRPSLAGTIGRLRGRLKVVVFGHDNHNIALAGSKARFLVCTHRVCKRCRDIIRGCDRNNSCGGGFNISARRCSFTIGTFISVIRGFSISRCRFTVERAGATSIVDSIDAVGDRIKMLCLDSFGEGTLLGLLRSTGLRFRRLVSYRTCMCL